MGDELQFGMLVRRIFTRLGDDDFDRLLRLLSAQTMQRIISKHGDMDYPSLLLEPLVSTFPGLKALSTLSMRFMNRDEWVKDVLAVIRTSS